MDLATSKVLKQGRAVAQKSQEFVHDVDFKSIKLVSYCFFSFFNFF